MKWFTIYLSGLLCFTSYRQPNHNTVLKENIQARVLLKNKYTHSRQNTISNDTINGKKTRAEIKILSGYNFNQGDVDPRYAKLKWEGLFESNGGYYIRETKIKFRKERSETDDSSQNTGWRITSDIKGKNILLISGAKLVNGKVNPSIPPPYLSAPGEKFEFKYQGITYTLHTSGFKKNRIIYNYKLFLIANIKGHNLNQLLRSIDSKRSFGGTGDMSTDVKIKFIGDLDGDKIPDFIIDESGYSFGTTYLYLSKPAGNESIVKLVSHFEVLD